MARDTITKYEKCGAIARMIMDTQTIKVAEAERDYFFACHRAYAEFFGDKDIKKMNALPRGWLQNHSSRSWRVLGTLVMTNFQLRNEVHWRIEDTMCKFVTSLDKLGKGYPKEYPFPAHIDTTVNKNHHAYEAFNHLLQTYKHKEKVRQEIHNLFRESYNAISTIRSHKGIIKAWPEMEKYLPMPPQDKRLKVQLPATNFDVLNGKLGLPKGEAA